MKSLTKSCSEITSSDSLTIEDLRNGIEQIKKIGKEPVVTKFEACKKHLKAIKEIADEQGVIKPERYRWGYLPLWAFPIIEKPYLKTIHAHFSDGHIEKIPVR